MGEMLGEQGIDLGIAVGSAAGRRHVRVGEAGSRSVDGGHTEAARGVVIIFALVLLVAHDCLARDLQAAARSLPATFGGFQGGPDAVLDVSIGSARGRNIRSLLVFLMCPLSLWGAARQHGW